MKQLLAAIALSMLLLGCNPNNFPNGHGDVIHIQGYVRNVWYRDGYFYVVFEHDNGASHTFQFSNQPPVWAGEHVYIDAKVLPKYADGPEVFYEEIKTVRLP